MIFPPSDPFELLRFKKMRRFIEWMENSLLSQRDSLQGTDNELIPFFSI